MFSYISKGEPAEFTLLPAGIYQGKIMKMEDGVSRGGTTAGCAMLTVHIRVFGQEGTTDVRYNLINAEKLVWKIDAFVQAVTGQTYQPGQQVVINPADYIGKTTYVRLSVRQIDSTKNPGTTRDVNSCDDILTKEEYDNLMWYRNKFGGQQAQTQTRQQPSRQSAPAPAPAPQQGTLPMEDDDIPF